MICGTRHVPPLGGFKPRSLSAFAIARVVRPEGRRRQSLAQRLGISGGDGPVALADLGIAELDPARLHGRKRLTGRLRLRLRSFSATAN